MIACTEDWLGGGARSQAMASEPLAIGLVLVSATGAASGDGPSFPNGDGESSGERFDARPGHGVSSSDAGVPSGAGHSESRGMPIDASGQARCPSGPEGGGSRDGHEERNGDHARDDGVGCGVGCGEGGHAPHPWFPSAVVHRTAPTPEDHAPRMEAPLIADAIARRGELRERRIEEIFATMQARDPKADRLAAILTYDFEHAPYTTNAEQLATIGVEVPQPGAIPETDAEVRRRLWTVIYGLTRFGIFLVNTDHLTDRRLLEVLSARILRDPVRDSGCSSEMSEFIDLSHCPLVDPVTVVSAPEANTKHEPGAIAERESSREAPDGLIGPFEQADCDDDATEPWDQGRSPRSAGAPLADRVGGTAPPVEAGFDAKFEAKFDAKFEAKFEAQFEALFGGPNWTERKEQPAVCSRDRLLPLPKRGGY